MALRDHFPFDKIFKLLDKIVSVAGLLKTLLDVFRKKKEAEREGD